jgi:hypothetical protein
MREHARSRRRTTDGKLEFGTLRCANVVVRRVDQRACADHVSFKKLHDAAAGLLAQSKSLSPVCAGVWNQWTTELRTQCTTERSVEYV